jgi:hypothetical protein
MPLWGQIAGFLSVIATVVGAAIKIVHAIHRVESRLQTIELRMAALEFQNRFLLKAFPQSRDRRQLAAVPGGGYCFGPGDLQKVKCVCGAQKERGRR